MCIKKNECWRIRKVGFQVYKIVEGGKWWIEMLLYRNAGCWMATMEEEWRRNLRWSFGIQHHQKLKLADKVLQSSYTKDEPGSIFYGEEVGKIYTKASEESKIIINWLMGEKRIRIMDWWCSSHCKLGGSCSAYPTQIGFGVSDGSEG